MPRASEYDAPSESTPSDDGYIYHGTGLDAVHGMLADGFLTTHKPWDFTDQGSWPDGSTDKRSYWTHSAPTTRYFANPDMGPLVIVRAKHDPRLFKKESTGDIYTTKKIPVHALEILRGGKWVPMTSVNNNAEKMSRLADDLVRFGFTWMGKTRKAGEPAPLPPAEPAPSPPPMGGFASFVRALRKKDKERTAVKPRTVGDMIREHLDTAKITTGVNPELKASVFVVHRDGKPVGAVMDTQHHDPFIAPQVGLHYALHSTWQGGRPIAGSGKLSRGVPIRFAEPGSLLPQPWHVTPHAFAIDRLRNEMPPLPRNADRAAREDHEKRRYAMQSRAFADHRRSVEEAHQSGRPVSDAVISHYRDIFGDAKHAAAVASEKAKRPTAPAAAASVSAPLAHPYAIAVKKKPIPYAIPVEKPIPWALPVPSQRPRPAGRLSTATLRPHSGVSQVAARDHDLGVIAGDQVMHDPIIGTYFKPGPNSRPRANASPGFPALPAPKFGFLDGKQSRGVPRPGTYGFDKRRLDRGSPTERLSMIADIILGTGPERFDRASDSDSGQRLHRAVILAALGGASPQYIANQTGMSPALVSQILGSAQQNGLVVPNPRQHRHRFAGPDGDQAFHVEDATKPAPPEPAKESSFLPGPNVHHTFNGVGEPQQDTSAHVGVPVTPEAPAWDADDIGFAGLAGMAALGAAAAARHMVKNGMVIGGELGSHLLRARDYLVNRLGGKKQQEDLGDWKPKRKPDETTPSTQRILSGLDREKEARAQRIREQHDPEFESMLQSLIPHYQPAKPQAEENTSGVPEGHPTSEDDYGEWLKKTYPADDFSKWPPLPQHIQDAINESNPPFDEKAFDEQHERDTKIKLAREQQENQRVLDEERQKKFGPARAKMAAKIIGNMVAKRGEKPSEEQMAGYLAGHLKITFKQAATLLQRTLAKLQAPAAAPAASAAEPVVNLRSKAVRDSIVPTLQDLWDKHGESDPSAARDQAAQELIEKHNLTPTQAGRVWKGFVSKMAEQPKMWRPGTPIRFATPQEIGKVDTGWKPKPIKPMKDVGKLDNPFKDASGQTRPPLPAPRLGPISLETPAVLKAIGAKRQPTPWQEAHAPRPLPATQKPPVYLPEAPKISQKDKTDATPGTIGQRWHEEGGKPVLRSTSSGLPVSKKPAEQAPVMPREAPGSSKVAQFDTTFKPTPPFNPDLINASQSPGAFSGMTAIGGGMMGTHATDTAAGQIAKVNPAPIPEPPTPTAGGVGESESSKPWQTAERGPAPREVGADGKIVEKPSKTYENTPQGRYQQWLDKKREAAAKPRPIVNPSKPGLAVSPKTFEQRREDGQLSESEKKLAANARGAKVPEYRPDNPGAMENAIPGKWKNHAAEPIGQREPTRGEVELAKRRQEAGIAPYPGVETNAPGGGPPAVDRTGKPVASAPATNQPLPAGPQQVGNPKQPARVGVRPDPKSDAPARTGPQPKSSTGGSTTPNQALPRSVDQHGNPVPAAQSQSPMAPNTPVPSVNQWGQRMSRAEEAMATIQRLQRV